MDLHAHSYTPTQIYIECMLCIHESVLFSEGQKRRTKVTSSVSCITSLSLLNVGIALCLVGQMKSRKLKWKSSVYLITSLSFWNLGTLLSWGGGGGGDRKQKSELSVNLVTSLSLSNVGTLLCLEVQGRRKEKWNGHLIIQRRSLT